MRVKQCMIHITKRNDSVSIAPRADVREGGGVRQGAGSSGAHGQKSYVCRL
jgi:hypothetical protein